MYPQSSSEDNGRLTTRLPAALVPALVAFVVTGLLSPLYSGDDRELPLTLWQAVVLWPIGASLLGIPAWLLAYRVGHKFLFRTGQGALIVVAVWAMAGTARSDDAQAGLNFLIVPWFGTTAVVCLMALQWAVKRRQPR